MDDDLRFYVIFNSISVISGRWEGNNGRLCAKEPRLRVVKYRVEHGSNAGYSQNYNKADKTKWFCFENYCYEQSVLLSRDILYKGGGESQNFVTFEYFSFIVWVCVIFIVKRYQVHQL